MGKETALRQEMKRMTSFLVAETGPLNERVPSGEIGWRLTGDEYYFNASVAYAPRSERVEPWEPNVSASWPPARWTWW